jgi:hypothetical protein
MRKGLNLFYSMIKFILFDDQMTACGTMANRAWLTRDSLGNEYGADVDRAILA